MNVLKPHRQTTILTLQATGQRQREIEGVTVARSRGTMRNALRGMTTEETPIARIDGAADVVLQDDRRLSAASLFGISRTSIASALPGQLECAMEADPMRDFVQTNVHKATSIPGVLCCGDMARAAGNVAFAVFVGATAGVAANGH